ncbi:MAG: porin [Gammaproteobacteria bacterium]|nr:MAG: porin [Gammaproteobacteria bacterium]
MLTIKKINTSKFARAGLYTSIAAAIIATPLTASAAPAADFTIGGFVKLSALYTDTDSGTIAGGAGGIGRTFYVPSQTPVGNGESHQTLDFTARETRLNFKVVKDVDGHKITGFIETDFLTTTDGNEVVSNSYSPRLRHAFFKVDNWLFGQTWSTFQDTGALPQAVDFLGSPEGIVFIRQPQVRYTAGDFQVALENPESFVSGSTDRDVGSVPDVAANYKFKGDWGHVRLNGLVRQITVDEGTGAAKIDESETGYGVGLSGKIKLGASDNVKFSLNVGDGMGRYTSLGLVKDGMLINGKIETVESTAVSASYHHAWNGKSSSNLILSAADIDNPTGATGTENKSADSVQINYLWSPVKPVTYGVMYLLANRETENGDEGKLSRIQFAATYKF